MGCFVCFGQTFPPARADKHVCNEFPECNGLALCAGGEESMRNRKGWKHWLFTGLALLGAASNVHGQTGSPYNTGAAYGGAPAMGGGMGGLGNHGPMSIAMPGPPPMEVAYANGPRTYVLCRHACRIRGGMRMLRRCLRCWHGLRQHGRPWSAVMAAWAMAVGAPCAAPILVC